ncbi:MAG: HIT domain-containing protein [bacterium]|nr:HIT domain-containing protein [bacterium]
MSDCLFCKIINKEIATAFVYETDAVAAFDDIHPKAPVHVLIVPKKHIETVNDAAEEDADLLGQMVLAAKAIAARAGIADRGYRLIVNCGQDGGQLIPHLHLHLLGGKRMGAKGEEF